jgi:hypothetical protein
MYFSMIKNVCTCSYLLKIGIEHYLKLRQLTSFRMYKVRHIGLNKSHSGDSNNSNFRLNKFNRPKLLTISVMFKKIERGSELKKTELQKSKKIRTPQVQSELQKAKRSELQKSPLK